MRRLRVEEEEDCILRGWRRGGVVLKFLGDRRGVGGGLCVAKIKVLHRASIIKARV